MDKVTVAATQMSCSWNTNENLDKAESLIREAKNQGAEIILLQELYETPYFCAEQKEAYFSLAKPFENHPIINKMATLAKDLKTVLPVVFLKKRARPILMPLPLSMPMVKFWDDIEKVIYRMVRVIRKNIILIRGIPDLWYGRPNLPP